MKLEIHVQARDNFNQKAEELKTKLKFKPEPVKDNQPQVGESHAHVSHIFDKTNTSGELSMWQTDSSGQIASRFFATDKRLIGLSGQDHKDLIGIAKGLQKAIAPKDKLSFTFISTTIFEWVKQQYKGIEERQLVEFILSEGEKKIKVTEIWIPISELHIALPFVVGNVTFRAITRQIMDKYEERELNKVSDPEDKIKMRFLFDKKRTAFQGLCIGTMQVEAESEKAYEIVLEEVEKAINIIRFFAPHNLLPRKVCYSAPYGQEPKSTYHYFFAKDKEILREASGIVDVNSKPWYITKEDFELYCDIGLDVLNYLITKEKLTDFQQKLLEAISLYSRSVLAKELSTKLVYILVALETMFLKDSSEYIQDNISLRMAFMHPVSSNERREIISNVKEVYKLRSSFIHHGQEVSENDLEVIEKFMFYSWQSMIAVIKIATSEITLKDFFEEMENRKIGG